MPFALVAMVMRTLASMLMLSLMSLRPAQMGVNPRVLQIPVGLTLPDGNIKRHIHTLLSHDASIPRICCIAQLGIHVRVGHVAAV